MHVTCGSTSMENRPRVGIFKKCVVFIFSYSFWATCSVLHFHDVVRYLKCRGKCYRFTANVAGNVKRNSFREFQVNCNCLLRAR